MFFKTNFDCDQSSDVINASEDESCKYSNAVQTAASVFKKVVLKKRLENNETNCGDGEYFLNI